LSGFVIFAAHFYAQVVELVDTLVSNTSDSNIMPVRLRPWVPKTPSLYAIKGKRPLSNNSEAF
jgi:hypothetical protein